MPKIGEIVLSPIPDLGYNQEITFKPTRVDNGVVTLVDRTSDVAVMQPQLTISSVAPSKTSRNTKVRFRLTLPIVQQPDSAGSGGFTPAPQKIGSCAADVTFTVSDVSNDMMRAALLACTTRLCLEDAIKDAVQNMEQFF